MKHYIWELGNNNAQYQHFGTFLIKEAMKKFFRQNLVR